MTQAEIDFIDQKARSLTPLWADYQIRHGTLPVIGSAPAVSLEMYPVYVEHALEKGWLSKKQPPMLLAKGFGVAEAFLRR